jgi:hypothetical protein
MRTAFLSLVLGLAAVGTLAIPSSADAHPVRFAPVREVHREVRVAPAWRPYHTGKHLRKAHYRHTGGRSRVIVHTRRHIRR